MKYVALLRGINVGGKAKLPMRELAAIFRAMGATAVETYIQSGNVIFDAPAAEACVASVTTEIARVYGYPGRIVLRSAAELLQAYRNNPFIDGNVTVTDTQADPLSVYFLADEPNPSAVKALDANRSPGDRFAIRNREVYLHLPQGMARTKLTNTYFDSKLNMVSTARNWRTVKALVDLCEP